MSAGFYEQMLPIRISVALAKDLISILFYCTYFYMIGFNILNNYDYVTILAIALKSLLCRMYLVSKRKFITFK
jgi:hypothetical protein